MKKAMLIMFFTAVVAVVMVFMWLDPKDESNETKDDPVTNAPPEEDKKVEERSKPDPVETLLNQMSLDEKIGQLFISGIEGTEMTDETETMIRDHALGGIILFQPNLEDPEGSLQLVNSLKSMKTAKEIPLFIGVDEEGGRVERLPGLQSLKTAAEIGKQDKAFAYDNGALLAKLVKGFGMNLNFAPVLDVNSNPDNPVIGDRAYSDHPDRVSELGIRVMQGMQDNGMITAVKHFPGHGDTEEDSHEQLPVVYKTREELEATEFVPFKSAVENEADMILMAHIKLPELGIDVPASFSEKATAILREEWGYDGVIITDDLTMGAITENYQMEEVTVDALKAGVDILMIAHRQDLLEMGIEGVKEAVEAGEMTEDRIDESVRRVLTLKNQYKLDFAPTDELSLDKLNQEIDDVYDEK